MSQSDLVLEINNCEKDILIEGIYNSTKFWETLSPVDEIKADFISPNVLHTKTIDKVKVVNFPIEMEGELVLIEKGEVAGKGRLIEFNVRNNKDVKKLEGNLRIKQIPNGCKVGIFISAFILESAFINILGKNAAELIFRSKLTDFLRNLEKFCKEKDLKELIK